MKFFKTLLRKDGDDLSPQELKELNFTIAKEKSTFVDEREDRLDRISHIILEIELKDINKIRNMLDEREKFLSGEITLNPEDLQIEEISIDEKEKNIDINEIDIKEDISEEDLNNETYEDDKKEKVNDLQLKFIRPNEKPYKDYSELEEDKTENIEKISEEIDEIIEKDLEDDIKIIPKNNNNNVDNNDNENQNENIKIEENNTQKNINEPEKEIEVTQEIKENLEEEKSNETQQEDSEENISEEDEEKSINSQILEKLRSIFGNENVFVEVSESSKYEMLDEKRTMYIGIRDKSAIITRKTQEEEIAWFVSRIKKLEELPNFKVLNSEDGVKELVWIKEDPTVIIFRSSDMLEAADKFIFPTKKN